MTDDELTKLLAIASTARPGPWFLAYATAHDEPRALKFMRIERTMPVRLTPKTRRRL